MRDPALAVIPARLASERLPRKPLHPILGRPLIERVWSRVAAMSLFETVVVATDAPEILQHCESVGAACVLTDPAHRSGTDRVAEVAEMPPYRDFQVIANVQGDEPLVEEEHLFLALRLVSGGGWDVGTCATPLRSLDAFENPSVVKVARAGDGRALYFSRAGIPCKREGHPTPEDLSREPYLRHLGIYVYRRQALLTWVALPPSPLEELERLEQLRALEGGMGIGVAVVEGAAPGVDTAEDVARMEKILSDVGLDVAGRSNPSNHAKGS